MRLIWKLERIFKEILTNAPEEILEKSCILNKQALWIKELLGMRGVLRNKGRGRHTFKAQHAPQYAGVVQGQSH